MLLPNRALTEDSPAAITADSLDAALAACTAPERPIRNVFVIGGASIYDMAMRDDRCATIFQTKIDLAYPACDKFFPMLDTAFWQEMSIKEALKEDATSKLGFDPSHEQVENETPYHFALWTRKSII